MSQNLSSASVVIGALRVNLAEETRYCKNVPIEKWKKESKTVSMSSLFLKHERI